MMIVSIDPINYKATLISIPGDLWVNVPGAGLMKIDAAWQAGEFKYLGKTSPGSTNSNAISAGFNLADQTVSQVSGLGIGYNVIVNDQAFQQAVDTLGGVNVNVPSTLTDPTIAWQNKNNAVIAQAGNQSFSGAQALLYVRSKETSNDFARAQRQRQVLQAIIDKSMSISTLSDPLKITQLVNSFSSNVVSDISIKDAGQIFNIFKKIDDSNIASIDLNSGPSPTVTQGNVIGQAVILPSNGLFNYSGIQNYLKSQLLNPYVIKESAKILVLNGTDVPGLATNLSSQLKSSGYNVIGAANTPTADWQHTTLVDLNKADNYTKQYLEQSLNVKASNSISDKSIDTNDSDFVIIIGSNESNISQTQAN